MKFLNFLKKILKKEQVMETSITTFSHLVVLPTREELKKEPAQIEQLEHLKQEYIYQISRKKLLTSLEIEATELRKKSDMYQELILNSMLKCANEQVSSKKNNMLKLSRMLKFKIYSCYIKKLEEETLLRLVALKEILEEKMSSDKQKVIFKSIIKQ